MLHGQLHGGFSGAGNVTKCCFESTFKVQQFQAVAAMQKLMQGVELP